MDFLKAGLPQGEPIVEDNSSTKAIEFDDNIPTPKTKEKSLIDQAKDYVSDLVPEEWKTSQPVKHAKFVKAEKQSKIKSKFDVNEAQAVGYSSEEIIDYMTKDPELANDIAPFLDPNKDADSILFDYQANYAKKRIEARSALKALKNNETVIGSDFLMGWNKMATGVALTLGDIAQAVGLEPSLETMQTLESIKDYGKVLSEMRDDDSMFSTGNLGEIVPQLATLPISAETKAGVFLLEGTLGYMAARGNSSVDESLLAGALSGTIGAGTGVIVDAVTGKMSEAGRKKALDFYKKQLNYIDEEVERVYDDWLKTMQPSGSEHADKLKAILDHSGYKGAYVKFEALDNLASQKAVDLEQKERKELLRKLGDESVDVKDIASNYTRSVINVNDLYDSFTTGLIKKNMVNAEVHTPFKSLKIDGINSKALNTINDLITRHKTTLDLMDASRLISDQIQIARSPYAKKQLLNAYRDVNKEIRKKLTPKDYVMFSTLNKQLARVNSLKANPVSKVLMDLDAGKITPGAALRTIGSKNVGEMQFNNLAKVVGTKDVENLERAIIAKAMDNSNDKIMWQTLAKNFGSKGFISKEGRAFTKLVDTMKHSFITDDVIRAANINKLVADSGGLSNSVQARIATAIVSSIFNKMQKVLPTETGKVLRMRSKLQKILSNPSKVREVEDIVRDMTLPKKADLVSDIASKVLKEENANKVPPKKPKDDGEGGAGGNQPNNPVEPTNPVSEAEAKVTDDIVDEEIDLDVVDDDSELFDDTSLDDLPVDSDTIAIKPKVNPDDIEIVIENPEAVTETVKSARDIPPAIDYGKLSDNIEATWVETDISSSLLKDSIDYIVNNEKTLSKYLQQQIGKKGMADTTAKLLAIKVVKGLRLDNSYVDILTDIFKDTFTHKRKPIILEHGTKGNFELKDINAGSTGTTMFTVGRGSLNKVKNKNGGYYERKYPRVKRGVFNLKLLPVIAKNGNDTMWSIALAKMLDLDVSNLSNRELIEVVRKAIVERGYDGILYNHKGYSHDTAVHILKDNVQELLLKTLSEGE